MCECLKEVDATLAIYGVPNHWRYGRQDAPDACDRETGQEQAQAGPCGHSELLPVLRKEGNVKPNAGDKPPAACGRSA